MNHFINCPPEKLSAKYIKLYRQFKNDLKKLQEINNEFSQAKNKLPDNGSFIIYNKQVNNNFYN